MFTILQIDEIAKVANERIKKEFEEYGFQNPPIFSGGMVRVVLEAAAQFNEAKNEKYLSG